MPTGAKASRDLFKQLVDFAIEKQVLLVNDNPYSFVLNDKPESILHTPRAMEVALELNSLSKSHHMAGWRVGMLCGAAERISTVLRFKSNMDSGQFLGIQRAAITALQTGPDWHKQQNEIYQRRKEVAKAIFNHLGCEIHSPQVGLFLWARIPEPWNNGFELSDLLLRETEVFITPGGIFGDSGNSYLRISLCSNEEVLGKALSRIESAKIKKL